MAGASLLALLDDIATILDDVAVMTKVAAKKSAAVADDVAAMTKVATQKTAGVLGDDLALNAQQVTGVNADRELPVVWAVAKGSIVNKAILVPAALAISAFLPWLITPLLMLGGAFLCFEGVEKLAHKFLHSPEEDEAEVARLLEAASDEKIDLVAQGQGQVVEHLLVGGQGPAPEVGGAALVVLLVVLLGSGDIARVGIRHTCHYQLLGITKSLAHRLARAVHDAFEVGAQGDFIALELQPADYYAARERLRRFFR